MLLMTSCGGLAGVDRWLRSIDEQKEKVRAAVESGESEITVRALQRGVTGLERQYGQWIIDYEAAGCPVTVHSPQAFSSPGEVREGHVLDGIPLSLILLMLWQRIKLHVILCRVMMMLMLIH
jgi:hypothetical protein